MLKIVFRLIEIGIIGICFSSVVYFLAKKIAQKKVLKESLSEIDFKNTKEYYRNILEIYNPFLISYIDDFKINYKNDIVATLLLLELKKKIEIKEKNIIVIDSTGLKKSEEYIINNINNGKLKISNLILLKEAVIEDAKEEGLILENKLSKKQIGSKKELESVLLIFKIPLIFILIFCILFIVKIGSINLINLLSTFKTITIIIAIFIVGIVIMNLAIKYLFTNKYYYGVYKNKSYSRTDKSEELNEKIEGLKNYVSDFGNLEEKERKELILWEDYLIYSVIFGLNTKIIDEISLLVEYK